MRRGRLQNRRRGDKSLINPSFISLALLVATALVAGYFAYIFDLKRQSYLLYWTAGWCFLALHYLGTGLSAGIGTLSVQAAFGQGLFASAGIFFFLGARQYTHRRLPLGRAIGAAAFVLAWTVANALGILPIPVLLASTVVYGAVGVEFWVESRVQETLADWLLAIVFF